MSIERTALLTEPENTHDPFYYGYRYVQRGSETLQVPLTLEDVLHPLEGDRVTVNDPHTRICSYLYTVIRRRVAKLFGLASANPPRPGAAVFHDMRVAWDDPEQRAHGPDLAVFFDVRERQDWGTFNVAREGARTALLIEVSSPNTQDVDFEAKRVEYADARVPLYVIVDIVRRRGIPTPRLLGYCLTDVGYVEFPPDDRGALWLEPVKTWLRIVDGEVVCENEQQVELLEYDALDDARLNAESRAEALALQAEDERLRADAERQRADSEAAGRAAAEQRTRELEAELRRLRGEN